MTSQANRPTFAAIREIPKEDTSEWQYAVLSAMKEDLEILMGTRNPAYRAVTTPLDTKSDTIVQQTQRITATGAFYVASGTGNLAANASVPTAADHIALAQNVQGVIEDVARLTAAVRALLDELRS